MGIGFGKWQPLAGGWDFEMPKRSSYAIALGVQVQPGPAMNRKLDRPNHAVMHRNTADGFYFRLEAFLDNWRREGMAEDVVRAALERAKQTSIAMESLGRRLTGR